MNQALTQRGTRYSDALAGIAESLDRNPAACYLARLGSPLSRLNMKVSLDKIARLLSDGRLDALGYDWASLRYQHVQAVRSKLTGAPASINRHLAALKGTLKEAWRLGLMTSDDYARAVDIAPVRGERLPPGRALTTDELRALFAACSDGSTVSTRNAALLAVLYGAGLRRSEVVALSLGDWNPLEGSLKVVGKGDKQRMVYINNGAREALDAWLKVRGEGSRSEPLFVALENFDGDRLTRRRLTPQTVFDALKALAPKAGIETFSPHDLRRSFISDLLDAGADIATVQKMAGHAKIETTARYDRRGEAAKSQAATLLKVPYVQ
jgi:site-specific recombinase XerD